MAPRKRANALLTTSEASRLLHVHINTVRRWSNRGIVKAYRIGPRGDRRFRKEDVARLLTEPKTNRRNGSESTSTMR